MARISQSQIQAEMAGSHTEFYDFFSGKYKKNCSPIVFSACICPM